MTLWKKLGGSVELVDWAFDKYLLSFHPTPNEKVMDGWTEGYSFVVFFSALILIQD